MHEAKFADNALCQTIKMKTVRERLVDRKVFIEEQLADVNAALTALDANPGFEAVHDAIVRAGY